MKRKMYLRCLSLVMTGAVAVTGIPFTAMAAEENNSAFEANLEEGSDFLAQEEGTEGFTSDEQTRYESAEEEEYGTDNSVNTVADLQEGTCGENVTWQLSEDGTLTISGEGPTTDYSVGSPSPFSDDSMRTNIKKVVFSEGVTSIGNRLLARCTELTGVNISSSVKTIGNNALYYCTALEQISIPEGVETIENEAFNGNRSLKNVTFPSTLKTIKASAFSSTKLEEIVFPNGLTTIDDMAFYGVSTLKKITLPASLEKLGNYAFYYCSGLQEIFMEGDAPASAATNCFQGCPDDVVVSVPSDGEGYFVEPWLSMDVQFREAHTDELNAIRAALLAQAKSDNAFWDILNRVNAGETITDEEKLDVCARAVDMAQAPYLDTSELAMAAIAINAMGLDASRVTSGEDTVDLISLISVRIYHNLVANEPEDEMGSELEDWTLALAAYDSGNHQLPSNAVWTRDKIIQHILDSQDEKGGWHFFDKVNFDWHPYATAQTMLVLAPYYTENSEVKEAVDTSMRLISEKFKSTGKLFVTVVGEEEDPADPAMVIAALRAYGIDVESDEDYIYTEDNGEEMTLVDYLLTFKQDDNTFGPNTNEIPYCPKGASALQAILSLGQYDGWLPYQTNCPDDEQPSPNAGGYEIPENAMNSVDPDGPLGVFAQKEDVTLKVGQTGKVTYNVISGTADEISSVLWESRDESVVKVDEEGNLTAVGEGETSLKLTINGNMFSSVKVTVTKPSNAEKEAFQKAKVNVTAKSMGYNSVKLTWKALDNATSYHVYRKVKGGKFTALATVKGLDYTDKTAVTGTTYYYTVKAFSRSWGEVISSQYVTNLTAKAVPAKSVISKSQTWGYNGAKTTWKKVDGATGYRVYYAGSESGTYKYVTQINSGKTTSYVQTGLTTGKTYYYKVRAYRTVNGTKVFGALSDAKSVKPVPTTTKIQKVTSGSKSAKVTWNKVNGATGYRVYYSTSKDSGYKYATQTSKTAYTQAGLKKGASYYYKVRAYRTVNGEKVFGAYSTPVYVTIK